MTTTALRAKGSPDSAPETSPSAPNVDAPRESPDGVLDLDGVGAPESPRHRWQVLSTKLPPSMVTWTMERAAAEGLTHSMWLRRLLERERSGMPGDVRRWLAIQAVQCGCPGDADEALIRVVRHLADRWPNGARLR